MSEDNNITLRKWADKKKDPFPVSWKTEKDNKWKPLLKK